MVAERSGLLPVRPEGIPEELKSRPQWVNWRLEKRDGDVTKTLGVSYPSKI
jgi:primase-polymerase (primpol)-like protein